MSDGSIALPFVIPDRSGGICSSLNQPLMSDGSIALPFVIPTAVEGSAVLSTSI
jgi:hypothetical protein